MKTYITVVTAEDNNQVDFIRVLIKELPELKAKSTKEVEEYFISEGIDEDMIETIKLEELQDMFNVAEIMLENDLIYIHSY